MRVAICIPSGDMLHSDFALALAALVRTTAVERLSLFNQRSSVLPRARNLLVKDALGVNADWLLWLDSDMTFPPITLDRLLAHDLDIVCGTYMRRTVPHELLGQPCEDQTRTPAGLTAMKYAGMGCMLVRADVFRRLPPPWFNLDLTADLEIHEDRWFCERARGAGFAVYVDDWLTLQLGHIGRSVFTVPLPDHLARVA